MRAGEITIAIILIGLGAVFVWQSSEQAKRQSEMMEQLSRSVALMGEISRQSAAPGTVHPAFAPAPVPEQDTASSDKLAESLGALAKAVEASTKVSSAATPRTAEQIGLMDATLMLTRATNPQIRHHATSILGIFGGEEAEQRLVAISQEDAACRSLALSALRQMGSDRVGEIVLDLIRKGTPADRHNAATLLPSVITPDLATEIASLLVDLPFTDDPDSRHVRRSVYLAFRKLPDPRANAALIDAIKRESDPSLLTAASQALSAASSRKELPQLCAILEGLPPLSAESRPSHYAILHVLADLRDLRSTEYVLPYLNADDTQIVRLALQALGQTKDPMAAKALCEFSSDDRTLRELRDQYLKEGFPGTRTEDGKIVPVSEQEMARMLAKRVEYIRNIEASVKESD